MVFGHNYVDFILLLNRWMGSNVLPHTSWDFFKYLTVNKFQKFNVSMFNILLSESYNILRDHKIKPCPIN